MQGQATRHAPVSSKLSVPRLGRVFDRPRLFELLDRNAASPGQVLRYADPAAAREVLADCLTRPTAMALDAKASRLWVTEFGGRLLSIEIDPSP